MTSDSTSYVYLPHEPVRASGVSEHRTSDNEGYVRSLNTLFRQLARAITIGDHAGAVLLGQRIRRAVT